MGQEEPDEVMVQPFLRLPPPLVTFVLLGAGFGIHLAAPVRILPEGWVQLVVGLPIVALGAGIMAAGLLTFHRAGTDITFSNRPSLIVQHGIYKWTRNPIYLGDTLVLAGIAFSVNTWWILVMLPLLVAFLQLGVILREEHFLEKQFGEPYIRYQSTARRWF